MKEDHLVFSNIKFIFKNIYTWDKSFIYLIMIQSIMKAFIPFVWVLAPKLIIDEIMTQMRFQYIIFIVVCSFIIACLLNYIESILSGIYQSKVLKIRFNFTELINFKAMTMDYKYIEDPKVLNKVKRAIMTVVNQDDGISGILQGSINVISVTLGIAIYGVILISYNVNLVIIITIMSFVIYITQNKVLKFERAQRELKIQAEREAEYINNVMSDFAYGKDIRLFNMKEILSSKKKLADKQRYHVKNEVEKRKLKGSLIDTVMFLAREGITYVFLIFSVIREGLTIGNFSLFLNSMYQYIECLEIIIKEFAVFKVRFLYVDDLRKFINMKGEDKESSLLEEHMPKGAYEIEFKNLFFSYSNSDKYIFDNFNLRIKAGEKLALVGINGAGKTTLVKLILRLYKPNSGEITINGINIWSINKEEYLKKISVVFQEISLFAYSLGENITLQDESVEVIDEDKADKIAEKVGINRLISNLHYRYRTNVLKVIDSEGVEFSGGENQKIAIMRALYKNGDIIIFDEPTAALDPMSEELIYKNFNDIVKDKTAIYISHRLASTRFCNNIAFIENGTVKEYGTHEELINIRGEYCKMFEIQAKYYNESGVKKIDREDEEETVFH